ncbi:MAG: type IV secretory system conjugative DNA transfer family protein [bacterium]|nr:type IV secretory system conjugative DNA transfer family protein [bacterium]
MLENLNFATPNEELEYLRAKVLEAEKKFESAGVKSVRESVVRESIAEFKNEAGIGAPVAQTIAVEKEAETLLKRHQGVELEEMMTLADTKGVFHALSVVEKLKNWRSEDDFHAFLINRVIQGLPVTGVKEKSPIYQAVHMRLFEIILPKGVKENEKPLAELIKSMEQLYAGLLSLAGDKKDKVNHLVFEIANPDGDEDTRIFVSVPESRQELFSRQLLSIFPKARMIERHNDYNIFNEFGITIGASASLSSSSAYPLKTFEDFGSDPLNVILNGFSKIPKVGSGAAIQIVFKPAGETYTKKFEHALKEIEKGKSPKEALRDEGLGMELVRTAGEMFSTKKKDKDNKPPVIDQSVIESIKKKLESPIVDTNIRLAVSAPTDIEADKLMHNFESTFNQFENAGKQSIKWQQVKSSGWLGLKDSEFYQAFIFRLFRESEKCPLNLKELSTILHFHTEALASSATLARSRSRSAPPPIGLADVGALLGTNSFQGIEKKIHISPEDRLRHFYTIGQTGTGKSTLLKNMIIDDIQKGEGACFIDPHGSDVQDILSNVPKERLDDVIYFDPASTERPMALNMLEYDPLFPEQKTFVVNELFSIFQKLYGGVPESMGPMFEQYFRNATMLVIEDPETGSTLLDVSRVMSNKEYRDLKISHCKNPIVVQFWREIAEKAGGEGSLANIVPYITSKFDVFLANDIMRPIIAQEKSSFNFREIMDQKKILLVNLSKGRLGDINANLIGLILVGKILMAALSRVDSLGQNLPNFYLYIDEFQNITTDSIATILSEARKYKLSLTIAHQFIAQLQEKIRDAVFGNVGTICAFRVGQDDAEYLEKQFGPVFSAADLSSIDNFNAYLKMLSNGRPVEPFDIHLMPQKSGDLSNIKNLKELSSLKYGRNKEEVEADIMAKYSARAI